MAISEARKVDYLWKKIGYGVTKTDTNGNLGPTNEPIASPLLLRGDKTWNQANLIPATPPGSTSGVVTVYPNSGPAECVAVSEATQYRSWKTNLTDWIPPEMGSQYLVVAYVHTAGDASNAVGSGEKIMAAGSGNNDEYFYDYQSGVIHFIGSNMPRNADTGNFEFSTNTLQNTSTNADMSFGTQGTGQYVFTADTGVVLPTGNTAARPSAQEGVLRFNTQTAEYEVSKDGSTWTNLRTDADASAVTKDIFAGDGSTTTFTLSIAPSAANNIIVYVDGVMQEPAQNYTISNTTIDFGDAAHDGARITVLHGFAD